MPVNPLRMNADEFEGEVKNVAEKAKNPKDAENLLREHFSGGSLFIVQESGNLFSILAQQYPGRNNTVITCRHN